MLDEAHHTNDNCHIEPFKICSELVRRKLVFIGDIQIQARHWCILDCLDMVHLLTFQLALSFYTIGSQLPC